MKEEEILSTLLFPPDTTRELGEMQFPPHLLAMQYILNHLDTETKRKALSR